MLFVKWVIVNFTRTVHN